MEWQIDNTAGLLRLRESFTDFLELPQQFLSMKQSSNIKNSPFQAMPAKIITNHILVSNANPEADISKPLPQPNYCNPAVHLKKNFLKFTKAASSTSHQVVKTQDIKKQQLALRRQQGNQMIEHNNNESLKFLKEENRILHQKIDFLEAQCQNKQKVIHEKDVQLGQLVKNIEQWQRKMFNFQENQAKLTGLMNYYQSLASNCQNCKQVSEKYKNISQNYEYISQKCNQLQKILQSKDLVIQNNLKAKNEEYKAAFSSKNNQIKSLDLRISVLQKQNQRLYQQLAKSKTIKDDERASKFQKIGHEFQVKMEQAINENSKLRSLINNLQGKIEQIKSKNSSLQNILKAYEDSQQMYGGSKARSEIQLLRLDLETAKEQYDKMCSKYDYEVLKLQNKLYQERQDNRQSLLDFSDSQRLREALMSSIWQIQSFKAKAKQRR